MNELELLIEENNNLVAVISDLKENLTIAEANLDLLKSELLEDAEETAAHQAYIMMCQAGIDAPLVAIEDSNNSLLLPATREQYLANYFRNYKAQHHKNKTLK
jgi:hypothetical protein